MASKEEFLAALSKLDEEEVKIPERGITVTVRELRGIERDAFESSMWDGEGKERKQNTSNLRARLVAKCVLGDDGKLMFEDSEAVEIGLGSGKMLDRLYDVACKLSGIGANASETALKN